LLLIQLASDLSNEKVRKVKPPARESLIGLARGKKNALILAGKINTKSMFGGFFSMVIAS
jgi:hypothetical protein